MSHVATKQQPHTNAEAPDQLTCREERGQRDMLHDVLQGETLSCYQDSNESS